MIVTRPAEVFLKVLRTEFANSLMSQKACAYRLAHLAQAACIEPDDLLDLDGPEALRAIAILVSPSRIYAPAHTLNASWRALYEELINKKLPSQ